MVLERRIDKKLYPYLSELLDNIGYVNIWERSHNTYDVVNVSMDSDVFIELVNKATASYVADTEDVPELANLSVIKFDNTSYKECVEFHTPFLDLEMI